MSKKTLMPLVVATLSVALSNCASDETYREYPSRRGGNSLDKPANRDSSRYQGGRDASRQLQGTEKPLNYVAPEESGNANPQANLEDPAGSDSAVASDSPTAPDDITPLPSTPPKQDPTPSIPPPATLSAPKQPAYGTPVIGKRGYVYPPGVEHKPENMVDIRDFAPGQKVRDPRTGNIFLVP